MATEEIQISQLELAQEVQGDMVFAVDTATDTKSLSVNQLKNHISQPLQANINAVDTSALHKYNISNCITEIPQDIKLELSNGTLTLKAGSKVYVPNGTGVFADVTIRSDITTTASDNGKRIIFINPAGTSISSISSSQVASGTTPPAGNCMFYNTSTNMINYYSSGTIGGQRAFPIAKITVSGGAISSIDQVFNGFGYIGSTIFALPGVKGLIPNGRNADGSLKNIEFTLSKVLTMTYLAKDTIDLNLYQGSTFGGYSSSHVYKQEKEPSGHTNMLWYNPNNNVYKYTTNSGSSWVNVELFNVGNAVIANSNGVITSLTPKTAFHAVDYNDFEKAMLKEDWVKVSTVPASPDPDKFYYIPEN